MSEVSLSPKYQVVIPKDVRKQIPMKPGQKFQVVAFDGMVHLVPVVPITQMRGFLKGIDISGHRDADRL